MESKQNHWGNGGVVLQERNWKTMALAAIGALVLSGCTSGPATSTEASPSGAVASSKATSVESGSSSVETAKPPEKSAEMKGGV